MKNVLKIKCIVGGILSLLLLTAVTSSGAQMGSQKTHTVESSIDFSRPVLSENNDFVDIDVSEADGVLNKEGCPVLPLFTRTFEFPLGTHLTSVEIQPVAVQTMILGEQVRSVPLKQKIGDQIIPIEEQLNQEVYNSDKIYPDSWFSITTGAGLNKDNEHVLFVSCRITPVRYQPSEHLLHYSTHFTLKITYEIPASSPVGSDVYSLVIISPAEFSEQLQPLVDHKNANGISTTLVTLDEIYSSFIGRDNPERIKYFIKHVVEDWGTNYVLFVGDMKRLPIRVTYASWWERDLLSDLYYADLYEANGDFCSWDSNWNYRFGEIDNDGNDLDGVDLYADVHIGRLPCTNPTEVHVLVNKIITYEEDTNNQIWFKRIIFAGGDTFPPYRGAPPFVYEGEITNKKVAQNIQGFDTTFLWTSKHTLHPWSFNREINKGAGFISYAGHGFEHGWGTFRPNSITKSGMIWYFTPYITGLKNGNKLPVIFFDACLTCKLDFNFTDLQNYFKGSAHILTRLFELSEDPSVNYPCFAGSLLGLENGGAIATIGATRTAYTWVDANGVYGGAGYLDVQFFKSYSDGVTAGEMLTAAQNAYIQNVGPDYFTMEEFVLLGDPSLMVGGYP
jgi:hypothetical protein